VLFPPRQHPDPPPRVVITGAGIVTALGLGYDANAAGFRAGRVAFRPVSLFDVSRQRTKTAAEVDLPADLPDTCLSARHVKRLDRAARLLLLAAHEAWHQAAWLPGDALPIVLGTTGGGMALGQEYFCQAVHTPHRLRRQPTRVRHYQAQQQGLDLAAAFDCHGPVTIIANACASGANAVGHAWDLLRRGHAARALAGGYDALCQLVFAGFDSLQALSPTQCRPFDAQRDGLGLGEGAAVLALETLDHARRRGATILGEIVGYGAATDAHHLTQPHPQGEAALASMTAACASAGLTPGQIDYVNAHGTGTPLNDSAEAAAIARWAGPRAATLPVSSTKSSIGHLLGAAGAVEAVVCLMALRGQWLPPTSTLRAPDPACVFPVVRQPTEARLESALTNSFGFGGANATLILRRWP
jgi:3-oxoacyl-[acyl-carrier-protein] synthase II